MSVTSSSDVSSGAYPRKSNAETRLRRLVSFSGIIRSIQSRWAWRLDSGPLTKCKPHHAELIASAQRRPHEAAASPSTEDDSKNDASKRRENQEQARLVRPIVRDRRVDRVIWVGFADAHGVINARICRILKQKFVRTLRLWQVESASSCRNASGGEFDEDSTRITQGGKGDHSGSTGEGWFSVWLGVAVTST